MTGVDQALLWAQLTLCAAILFGLSARGRLRSSFFFPLYIASVVVPGAMVLIVPSLYTWGFWVTKETAQTVAKFGLALELIRRAFGQLPRAQAVAHAVAFVVLAATATVAFSAQQRDTVALAQQVLPRILYGTMWLFAVILGLSLWYRVPLDPLHKAILIGLVPYLLLFTGLVSWLEARGWGVRIAAGYANAATYDFVLGYWAWVAWRREDADVVSAEALRVLQPWRG